MHYSDGAFWRPLFEDDMEMLEVASGCSHNSCAFCAMYHHPFAPAPLENVEADIDELAGLWRVPPRLFLAGGNAFHLDAERLLRIAGLVREKLPQVKSLGCFARVEDIALKSDDELRALADAGFSMISIGAESGLDSALQRVRKGHTAADIVEQCARLDAAGITYAFFYLAGIAGKGRGLENARETARVFSQANPQIIMIHTMTPFMGTELEAQIEEGTFEQEPEVEIMQELREFYALYPKHVRILANHYANTVCFDAMLPAHRTQVLELMDKRIAAANEEALARFRRSIKSI